MSEQAYPSLNGEAQSWANISAVINVYDGPAVELGGITAVKWGNAVERGVQKSTSGKIVKHTRGAPTPSASFECYADQSLALIEKLVDVAIAKGFVENGIAKYGMVAFDLVIMHTPLGAVGIAKTELLGCQLSDEKGEFTEGTDADKTPFELTLKDVVRTINGKKASLL